jgi:hypothetical protein
VRIFPLWSFLGLFASPVKILVVVGAVVALAWRTGWFQRLLFQLLTRRLTGEPAGPQQGSDSTSTAATAPVLRRRWNWRTILLVFLIAISIVLVISRAHVTRVVAPETTPPVSPNPVLHP